MRIEEEVERIRARINRYPNNIGQFAFNKDKIIEVKSTFKEKYGYEPKLSECVYLISNGLTEPAKCKRYWVF